MYAPRSNNSKHPHKQHDQCRALYCTRNMSKIGASKRAEINGVEPTARWYHYDDGNRIIWIATCPHLYSFLLFRFEVFCGQRRDKCTVAVGKMKHASIADCRYALSQMLSQSFSLRPIVGHEPHTCCLPHVAIPASCCIPKRIDFVAKSIFNVPGRCAQVVLCVVDAVDKGDA